MFKPFKTAIEIQQAYSRGESSSATLTQDLLGFIDTENSKYRAIRELNPDALSIAKKLDTEREAGRLRSPLHGVPILLKDAFPTNDSMRTSYGVLALAELSTKFDSQLVSALRNAGAIILGKCSCTDFGDYMSSIMPAEHSSTGGIVSNPRGVRYGRGGGSSTGSAAAVAAGFAPISIGSEAQNSIQGPAANTGLCGFKPTVGLLPSTREPSLVMSQTTAGVIANTVTDLALVMGVLMPGANFAGLANQSRRFKIGVPRRRIFARTGMRRYDEAFEKTLSEIDSSLFEIIDNADLDNIDDLFGLPSVVFKTEFRKGLESLLTTPGVRSQHRHLGDIIQFNETHAKRAIPYGQDLLLAAAATVTDDPAIYSADRKRDISLSRENGIDKILRDAELDALMVPMDFAAKITGKAGYPVITIPSGETSEGSPFAISFIGTANSEQMLFDIGFVYEKAIAAKHNNV